MNHITEEQLVSHYYGDDAAEAAQVEEHLAVCGQCRAEYASLQLVLNTVNAAPVPERPPEYGTEVWRRIEPKMGRSRGWPALLQPRWWVLVPVTAMLMVAAFVAGRVSQVGQKAATASNGQVKERILLVAVGDHLDRSQMILAELSNAPDGKGKVDISGERQAAEDLLEDNRLYRETARRTGDRGVAGVLDDLERTLAEIANSPSQVSKDQFEHLRQEIQDRGLLFKIRVLGTQVRQKSEKKL